MRTFCLLLVGVLLSSCGEGKDTVHPLDDTLRLNHLQCEGTHNSYHVQPNEMTAPSWSYTMAPMAEQLDTQGVRKLEIDVHWDADLRAFQVYHLPRFDQVSTCPTFVDCITGVRDWSRDHPGHHPIFIQIEPKTLPAADTPDRLAALSALDAEILSVFAPEEVITPDEVQGARDTLDQAVTEDGWPTLGQTRGRVLFFLNCSREDCVAYANEGSGLDGRLIFADSEEGDSWSAVRIQNTPNADARAAVEAGYLVRTFADGISDLLADGSNDLEAALASGAHMISTDVPAPRPDMDYFVEIPGGTPSRCNPITAPPGCTSLDIEDPSRLR
ncbi:MAG: hypothetical protein H6726_29140 [Sandaracinaceae bacterium]|nr:hypothetical protein [Myxococcales bacterium]MCB9661745.1 hypothetical protein [Sandaracinaceae bacterium]